MGIVLKGNVCYSQTINKLRTVENCYLVCEGKYLLGVFKTLPMLYKEFPLADYGDCLIIPGLCDLHVHAPQFAFRGLGMDMELLDWLNTYTFPEESKYIEIDYANKAYGIFTEALKRSATTRACIFATLHTPATMLLMEKLEKSGIVSMVGKVGMDRNCPDILRQVSAEAAYLSTKAWIEDSLDKFERTTPIITPRFIPTCSDELMRGFKKLQAQYSLPVQSHLSENIGEVEWVSELCPSSASYADAYEQFGLFGSEGAPTVMAHCVYCNEKDDELLQKNGVYVAHCPQSNINLASGIAPVRRYLKKGINTGLGSDVAGGCHLSILRAMSDAVGASKLYWRLISEEYEPLTLNEAFYLGTTGGGSFFGKVGKFEPGYEFDALVIDDSTIPTTNPLTLEERLARVIYCSNDSHIIAKYVRGEKLNNEPDK
ncbi:MAG: amidohydrolase family protein [Oscillospiraceae bacterium]|nr:amidohydrolase family protein [Oscillospiraceae bacterium]